MTSHNLVDCFHRSLSIFQLTIFAYGIFMQTTHKKHTHKLSKFWTASNIMILKWNLELIHATLLCYLNRFFKSNKLKKIFTQIKISNHSNWEEQDFFKNFGTKNISTVLFQSEWKTMKSMSFHSKFYPINPTKRFLLANVHQRIISSDC